LEFYGIFALNSTQCEKTTVISFFIEFKSALLTIILEVKQFIGKRRIVHSTDNQTLERSFKK
jgi:hypothetical protein